MEEDIEIFMLEFFIDQIVVPDEALDANTVELEINVTCNDPILMFTIYPHLAVGKFDIHKHKYFTGGKSILFSSSRDNILSTFSKPFNISVFIENEEFGYGKVTWSGAFKNELKNLTTFTQIRRIEPFDIKDLTHKKVGRIFVNMGLFYYGPFLEIPLSSNITSMITLPILQGNKRSSEEFTEAWKPLFNAVPSAHRPSILDRKSLGGMEPSYSKRRISKEFINNHICGHKYCPGAQLFQEYGLGPLGIDPVLRDKTQKQICKHKQCPHAKHSNENEICNDKQCPVLKTSKEIVESCCGSGKKALIACTCKCCMTPVMKNKFLPTCKDKLCPSMQKRSVCKGLVCPHFFTRNRICGTTCKKYDESEGEDRTCGGMFCPYSSYNANKKCCVSENCPVAKQRRNSNKVSAKTDSGDNNENSSNKSDSNNS